MKEMYTKPVLEIEQFKTDDVITPVSYTHLLLFCFKSLNNFSNFITTLFLCIIKRFILKICLVIIYDNYDFENMHHLCFYSAGS